jgi:DNA-binding NarL/FixJ family response regulator
MRTPVNPEEPNTDVPLRVLLVDDSPCVREALKWALEEAADLMVVGEAEDGEQAVRSAQALNVEVVILDIEIPRLNGFSVSIRLKKLNPPPVIVFLSVHGDPETRRRGREAGGDAFFEKGTGWAALLQQVRRSLEARGGSLRGETESDR